MKEKTKTFADGFHLVVKQECETCQLTEPVIRTLAKQHSLNIYVQDDEEFLADLPCQQYDGELENSFYLEIDTVPTLLMVEDGKEIGRVIGWHREEWRGLTGVSDLGAALPDWRPGCGSKSGSWCFWANLFHGQTS